MDLVIDRVSSRDEARPGRPYDTILVKKKRALVPETADAKLLPSDQALIDNDRCASDPGSTLRSDGPLYGLRGVRKGFQTLYAGHSPPQA